MAAEPAPRTRPGLLPRAFLLGLLTAACTWFSISLTRFDGGVSAFWIANGLLTGVLLLSPRASWRGWILGAAGGQAAARLAHGDTAWIALLMVAINVLECWIVSTWVRRSSDALGVDRSIGRMARDAMVATLVACAISASLVVLCLFDRLGTPPLTSWMTWYAAHVTGMVVVATLTVCALQPGVGVLGRAGRRVDYALSLSLLLAVCAGVFWQDRFPLLFLTYLPLQFLVWRHGLSGMMAGVVFLAATSGFAAAQGGGPFALIGNASPFARMLFWQFYVAAGCLLAYSTAVAMARRRQLERRLVASEARFRELAAKAERQARFDELTGVANRRQFDEALAAAVARAPRTGAALMLLSLDLDNFKEVNDRLGHAAGDEVLREFARRIRDGVYDVDLVARLGGDEFVVLVEYSPTEASGELIASHLVREMRPPFQLESGPLQLSASIGIGLHQPVQSGARLMALADQALYEAKSRGRNTWALQRG
jgi:diguanylate cyclase (GGDEF)-like protein